MICSDFIEYNLNITGDCSNSLTGGTISFSNLYGASPGFTFQLISPFTGFLSALTIGDTYQLSGLSAGTYTIQIQDSNSPTNNSCITNIYISSGSCFDISSDDTSCGLDNGQVTAYTTFGYSNYKQFDLYEETLGFITSALTTNTYFIFTNLPSGFYYVIGNDGGGCTGRSETCLVKSSILFDFGIYKIDSSPCISTTGAIYVTGVTGTPPYTYNFTALPPYTIPPMPPNSSFVTGLTANTQVEITVTDSNFCQKKIGPLTISLVPSVDIVSTVTTNPDCNTSNGQVIVTLSGGTAPFFFSGSNGQTQVQFSNTYTFTGLSAGIFSIFVQDAGLCEDRTSVSLSTPNTFVFQSVTTSASTCNSNDGSIVASVLGGSDPVVYTLYDSLGNITNSYSLPPNSGNVSFLNLPSDTYTLTIVDSTGCPFNGTYTINNVDKFTLSGSTTGTTCDLENGTAILNILPGGTPPYSVTFNGDFNSGPLTSYTYTNLASGNYTATVIDDDGCIQYLPIVIDSSNTVDFILVGTSPTNGDNGIIEALITDGEPTFTLSWSSNVNGQTGSTIYNLSAGTYTLTVTDSNGCVRTRSITLEGFNKLISYQLFEICTDDFAQTGQLGRKGPQQFVIEGFHDLTMDFTNCELNQTIFTLLTEVDGVEKSQVLYTGTTINDFPTDDIYYNALEELLLSYEVIGQVIIDALNNTLTIITNCEVSDQIQSIPVKVSLNIFYDISCVTCCAKQFQNSDCFEFMDGELYEFQDQ